MSFSDPTQEYLLVRPPQSLKPGTHTSHNLQIQRLIPLPNDLPPSSASPAVQLPRGRILPILNLETHSLRKTRIVDIEKNSTICKFDTEPKGVIGKWQIDEKTGDAGGWIFLGRYERYEWSKGRTSKGEECWTLNSHSIPSTRRKSTFSEARTVQSGPHGSAGSRGTGTGGMSPPEGLEARVILMPPSPPMMIVNPSVVEQSVNKQEVMDALVMGLWIVWREGVVKESDSAGGHRGKRNSWSKGNTSGGKVKKRGFLDVLLCRN